MSRACWQITALIGIVALLGATVFRHRPHLAHLLWINVHGLAALAVADQLDLGKSHEELMDASVRVVLGGLQAQVEQ